MRLFKRACVGVLLLAVVVLAARLAWVASQLETAPGLLLVLVRNASLGWIGLGHQPIASASAREQAEFWKAEAERILAAEPTGQLALGAALMLDRPSAPWGTSTIVRNGPWVLQEYYVSPYIAESEFEAIAARDCLRWAERATELDADNLDVWRSRAMLQFRRSAYNFSQSARDPSWQSILALAQERDPDNGLYAALAADIFWDQYIKTPWPSSGQVFAVQYAGTLRHIAQAIDAPLILGPTKDNSAVFEFLTRARVPRHELADLLSQRAIFSNRRFLYSLRSTQYGRAREASGPEKLRLSRQYLQLLDRLANYENLCDPDPIWPLDVAVANQALPALSECVDDMSPAEIKQIEAEAMSIRTRQIVAQQARTMPVSAPISSNVADDLWYSLAIGHALPLAFLFGLLAGLCIALTWLIGPAPHSSQRRFGWLRHAACWLSAGIISFVLFGIVPARLIDLHSQETIVALSIVLLVTTVLGTLLVLVALGRRSQRALLAILMITLLVGVLVGNLSPESLVLQGWSFYGQAAVPTVEPINPSFAYDGSRWTWAYVQWSTYPGPLATIGLALLLVSIWCCYWTWRQNRGVSGRWRRASQAALAEVRSGALFVALLSLIIFLAAAPELLSEAEANYQALIGWCRQYPQLRADYLTNVWAIESDPAQMAAYRAEARMVSKLNRDGLPLVNSPDSDASEVAPTDTPTMAD